MSDKEAAAREKQLADLLLFCPFVASPLESGTLLELSNAILVRPQHATNTCTCTRTRTHATRDTPHMTHAQEEQMGCTRGEGDAARLRPESHLGRGPLDVAHRE